MARKKSSPSDDRSEDRPLECSDCKKPISVRYTEVVGSSIVHTVMCAECPHLEHRLHGIPGRESEKEEKGAGLCCGNCGTTLQQVRTGSLLGCAICYDVFGDVLVRELTSMEKIPAQITKRKKSSTLHFGKVTGETKEVNPSVKLLALNEALTETLAREDYEQAAWLRDQINEITEMKDE